MITCSACGRGSIKAASRSHSNIKTNRRQKVNLQPRRVDGRRVLVCTSCMRTEAKKVRAA